MKRTLITNFYRTVCLSTLGMKDRIVYHLLTSGKKDFNTTGVRCFTSFPSFIPNKKKYVVYMDVSTLSDITKFREEVASKVDKNNVYTVFIKVRYNMDNFFMAGNQFGFDWSSDQDYEYLFNDVNTRISEYFSFYNLIDDDIAYIQLSFRLLDSVSYSHLVLDKHKVKDLDLLTSEKKDTLDIISIPNSFEGKPLPVVLDINNNISKVNVYIKGVLVNFMEIILKKSKLIRNSHKDAITTFSSHCMFYYIKGTNNYSDYILVVKPLDQNTSERFKYSLSGVLITKVKDTLSGNMLYRTKGSEVTVINDNSIVSRKSLINFKPLEKTKIKDITWLPNPNIGVIDIETYSNENIHKVYALGFRTNLSDKTVLYYINTDYDSNYIVLSMIDELLKSKYSKITFYCHNFGGYDSIFLLKVLNTYNENNKQDQYKLKPILKDHKLIKLTISKGRNSFTILDSYCMLPSSLEKLGSDFNVETRKSIFPYKFSIKENLFYKGVTPPKEYYNDISNNDYKKIYKENWSFKDETIKYLDIDLNSLYEIMVSANRQIFKDYKINIFDSITISALAMKIFLNTYYNDNIPRINKPSIYRDIKKGYYGGCTEVYKPYGEKLFYYDVNSLYPFVSLNDMPGLSSTKCIYYTNSPDISELYGFFYCKIDTPKDLYIGLLPIRTPLGIEFPLGEWSDWYFSEELKFAQENGYKITVLKGYNFSRETNVFTEYINSIYKIKSNPKSDTQKSIAKSLLNNLLGRFGINLDKPITEIVNSSRFDTICYTNKIVSYNELNNNKYLVSYIPKISSEVVKSHNLDFLEVIKRHKDNEIQDVNNSSIVISAAITAYARIHINKIKLYILSKGGSIYYSDTDSIVTNIELNKNLVNPKELGKLKLEHIVKKGIFITNKTYCIINEFGEFINKAKGIKSNSLSYDDYCKLLNNETVKTGIKTESKKDWSKGDVSIINKDNITINSNSYTKRIKVYDQNNNWINTLPKIINRSYSSNRIYRNYFDKDLIIYKNKDMSLFRPTQKLLDKKNTKMYWIFIFGLLLVSIVLCYLNIDLLYNFWFENIQSRWYDTNTYNYDDCYDFISNNITNINSYYNTLDSKISLDYSYNKPKGFLRQCFGMLYFNEIKYYPSMIQNIDFINIPRYTTNSTILNTINTLNEVNKIVYPNINNIGIINHTLSNNNITQIIWESITNIQQTTKESNILSSSQSLVFNNDIDLTQNNYRIVSQRNNDNLRIIDSLVKEIQDLENSNTDKDVVIVEQNSQLGVFNYQLENYKSFIINSSTRTEPINVDISYYNNKILDLTNTVYLNNTHIEYLNTQLFVYSKDISNLNNTIIELNNTQNNLTKEIINYTDTLKEFSLTYYESMDILNYERNEIIKEITRAYKDNNNFVKNIESLTNEVNTLTIENNKLNKEVTNSKYEINSLVSKLKIESEKAEEYIKWFDDKINEFKN